MKADPVFAADQLSRQASAAALARNMSVKSSTGGSGLISLAGEDLASVEELSGEAESTKTKRKRVIDHDESESEGELYEEGEESDDADDEDYEERGGKKSKKQKSSTKRRRVEEEVDEEDIEPATMDIFAQHDATQALLKQKEELLQIRQQGSAAAAAGVGVKGGSASAGAASFELQCRAEGRQRTRDAVWAAFGQPRKRKGRRRRGESFAEDESDSMSECSDVTSVSSSTVTSNLSKNVSASSTTNDAAVVVSQAAMDRTDTKNVDIAQTGIVMPTDHQKTGNFAPNISYTYKKVSRALHSQHSKGVNNINLRKRIEKTDFFEKYFMSSDEVEQEKESTTVYLSAHSYVENKGGNVEGENENKTEIEINTPQVADVDKMSISTMTAVAETVSNNRNRGGKKPMCSHRISISRILKSQPMLTSIAYSMYDVVCAEGKENVDEESDLFISEKIVQMRYSLQSGSILVQLLVPWSLLCQNPPSNEVEADQVPESDEHQTVRSEDHPAQSLVVAGTDYHLPSLTSSSMAPGLPALEGSGPLMSQKPILTSALGYSQSSSDAMFNPPLLMSSSSMTLMSGLADPLQGGAPQGGTTMLTALSNGQTQAPPQQISRAVSQPLTQPQSHPQQGLLPSVQQAIQPLVSQGIQQPLQHGMNPVTQPLMLPGQQVTHTLPQHLTQPPMQQVSQPPLSQHREGNLRIQIAPSFSDSNVGDDKMPVSPTFSRARSASATSPPSRIRRRSRSGSLGCISPSSREREKRLRKKLQHVDEILTYVRSVQHRKDEEACTAHPLQYMLRQCEGDMKGETSFGPMNVCAVVMPSASLYSDGRVKATGVCVGYRNDAVRLLLSSEKRGVGVQRDQSRHRQRCISRFINQPLSEAPAFLRDSFTSDESVKSSPGVGWLQVQPTGMDLHKMTASLPGGVHVSARMVSATSGVLVSQQAERITMRVSSGRSCLVEGESDNKDGLKVDEDEEDFEYAQLWVLSETEEALSMDLRVNIAW